MEDLYLIKKIYVFFSRRSDIWSHIYRASIQSRLSLQDQGNLAFLVKQWTEENPEDKFFYQPYRETKDFNVYDENANLVDQIGPPATTLIFVYQTKDQRRLLHRYAQNVCLLDATRRTTEYAVLLFFMATKTNVDYQIIGSCFKMKKPIQFWKL